MTDDLKTPAELYGYDEAEFNEEVETAVRSGRARREAKKLLLAEECPTQSPPDIMDLRARLALPRVPTQFRVAGWQPCDSRIIIAAQAKAGKSTLTHNLIRCLVDGDRFLGRWKTDPIKGAVTVLDFELSESQMIDWFDEQGIVNDDKVLLCSMRGNTGSFAILDPATRAQWAEKLAEVGTDYLILDCLRPVLDALGLDEHKDAGKFLNAFDALLKEAGIAEAAVVHHMGHGGERSRGDSRIIDWPDATWRLSFDVINDQQSERFIRADGRDVAIPEHKLDYDHRRFKAAAADKDTREMEAAHKAIVKIMREVGEPISGSKLESALKDTEHGRNAIRSALRVGARRGLFDARTGTHNAILYGLPKEWARRVGGGHGDEHGWGGTGVE